MESRQDAIQNESRYFGLHNVSTPFKRIPPIFRRLLLVRCLLGRVRHSEQNRSQELGAVKAAATIGAIGAFHRRQQKEGCEFLPEVSRNREVNVGSITVRAIVQLICIYSPLTV